MAAVHQQVRGAYAVVAMIIGHGMVAFRDPNGIRPLVLGKRELTDGRTEYMVASESVALDTLGFEFIRDVAPSEAVYITEQGSSRRASAQRTRKAIRACSSTFTLRVRTRSSTRSPSTAHACAWASWARKLPASGKILILTW